jgi:hypothetical protein
MEGGRLRRGYEVPGFPLAFYLVLATSPDAVPETNGEVRALVGDRGHDLGRGILGG